MTGFEPRHLKQPPEVTTDPQPLPNISTYIVFHQVIILPIWVHIMLIDYILN